MNLVFVILKQPNASIASTMSAMMNQLDPWLTASIQQINDLVGAPVNWIVFQHNQKDTILMSTIWLC